MKGARRVPAQLKTGRRKKKKSRYPVETGHAGLGKNLSAKERAEDRESVDQKSWR